MEESRGIISAQIPSANLSLSEVQSTNTPLNKHTKINIFEPISLVDQIYGCAFSPENAKQYLQNIMEYFSADGVLLSISKQIDQSLCFHCAIGEVEFLQPNAQTNSQLVLHCNARNTTLNGSLILFAGTQNTDFSDVYHDEFAQLQPHFARSLDISAYLNFADKTAEKLTAIIEAVDAPLGIASQIGEILAINNIALDFLGLSSAQDFTIDSFWVQACCTAITEDKIDFEFNCNGKKFLARLRSVTPEMGNVADKITISFFKPQPEFSDGFSKLKLAYGLTSAEQEILLLLNDGHSASKIAQIRNSSRETVRVQLRVIMEKTDTKSQINLIALVRGK